MKTPIEMFLSELKDTVYYDAIYDAIRTDMKVAEISEGLNLSFAQCDSRIYYGALRMGVRGGRAGLKTEYIQFLEGLVESQRGR